MPWAMSCRKQCSHFIWRHTPTSSSLTDWMSKHEHHESCQEIACSAIENEVNIDLVLIMRQSNIVIRAWQTQLLTPAYDREEFGSSPLDEFQHRHSSPKENRALIWYIAPVWHTTWNKLRWSEQCEPHSKNFFASSVQGNSYYLRPIANHLTIFNQNLIIIIVTGAWMT